MKFRCGMLGAAREARKKQWHPWFAWHPVRLGMECYWLEIVERKGEVCCGYDDCFWSYEYRHPVGAST